MAYFITGGTGFIGRNFIERLGSREGDIYVLTRAESMHKFEELQERVGEHGSRRSCCRGVQYRHFAGISPSWQESAIKERLAASNNHWRARCAVPGRVASYSDPRHDSSAAANKLEQFRSKDGLHLAPILLRSILTTCHAAATRRPSGCH